MEYLGRPPAYSMHEHGAACFSVQHLPLLCSVSSAFSTYDSTKSAIYTSWSTVVTILIYIADLVSAFTLHPPTCSLHQTFPCSIANQISTLHDSSYELNYVFKAVRFLRNPFRVRSDLSGHSLSHLITVCHVRLPVSQSRPQFRNDATQFPLVWVLYLSNWLLLRYNRTVRHIVSIRHISMF